MIERRIRRNLRQISDQLTQLANTRLLPHNITSQQALILRYVCTEQRAGRVICQRDIEVQFKLKGSSITSLLKGLERKAFVTRCPDPADERRKLVTARPKALALMVEFETAFDALHTKMMQGFSHEQQEAIAQALEQMARNLEQEELF